MILVHGGAGQVAPDRQERVRAGLRAAAAAGRAILERGGSALDAVVGAVRVLEDDPEFGAGIGSAFTREGTVETCASVMDGAKRRAGAVAAVPNFGMPVVLARRVLEAGEHVVLAGGAALQYASEIGMPPAQPNGLVTERTMAQFRQAQAHKGAPPGYNEGGGVGAVARDKTGAMAAATSTGGTLYRRAGAIDDSAVPGAGTWADTDRGLDERRRSAVPRRSRAQHRDARRRRQVDSRRGQVGAAGAEEAIAEGSRCRRDHGQQGQLGCAERRPAHAGRVDR